MFIPQVKAAVTVRQLLEHNGFRINRQGFCVCPLHGDRDASLKVYGGERGWVCYGCHKGGDVINLAKELYGETLTGAIRRLDSEFSLKLPLDEKVSAKNRFLFKAWQIKRENDLERERHRKELLEKEYWDTYDMWMFLDRCVRELEPERDEEPGPAFRGYLKMRAVYERRLDDLETRRTEYHGTA
jgi:hypothetical protein